MNPNAALIRHLSASVERCFTEALAGRPIDAVVDFPDYANVGDSAIYLGQLACMKAIGAASPKLVSDFWSYDPRTLERALGDGVIVMTGGGSFGDVWPEAQQRREEILRDFAGHPVVQLPQSIHFGDPERLDRARAALDVHGAVTLLVRDRRSERTARHELDVEATLCPDMAFCLGSLARDGAPTRDVVWLGRGDVESRHRPPPSAAPFVTDWLDEPSTPLGWLARLASAAARQRPTAPIGRRLQRRCFHPLARTRLARGIALLSTGRVAVTDRLHGHILCLLLGIPHVVLDNSYGKLSAFRSTWTAEAVGVEMATDGHDALARVRRLSPCEGRAMRGSGVPSVADRNRGA